VLTLHIRTTKKSCTYFKAIAWSLSFLSSLVLYFNEYKLKSLNCEFNNDFEVYMSCISKLDSNLVIGAATIMLLAIIVRGIDWVIENSSVKLNIVWSKNVS
jgi:hypothetical protein